jgi:hypothetical protein
MRLVASRDAGLFMTAFPRRCHVGADPHDACARMGACGCTPRCSPGRCNHCRRRHVVAYMYSSRCLPNAAEGRFQLLARLTGCKRPPPVPDVTSNESYTGGTSPDKLLRPQVDLWLPQVADVFSGYLTCSSVFDTTIVNDRRACRLISPTATGASQSNLTASPAGDDAVRPRATARHWFRAHVDIASCNGERR